MIETAIAIPAHTQRKHSNDIVRASYVVGFSGCVIGSRG
jgi:hypothetical protein